MTPKRLGHECFAFVGKVNIRTNWIGQGCSKVFEAYINSPIDAGRARKQSNKTDEVLFMNRSQTLESVLVAS